MSGGADYKLVVMGGGGVGKSALTVRFVTGDFPEDYDPTIEDSYRKPVTVDGRPCLLEILDTAGQEEFTTMQEQWIRKGDGFILVYSIQSEQSFHKIQKLKMKIERSKDTQDNCIVIAGNKCDLTEGRQVETSQGEKLAKEWDAGFFETSAKLSVNNEEIYYELIRIIRKKTEEESTPEPKKDGFCVLL